MLSFANPLFLFLLPLAAGPLVLHLLSLRRMRRTEFSSLFFLRRMRERRFRWLKLRDILLLVLRTLFLAFLVLALAGPSLQGRLPLGRIKADLVIILDDSYSTAARFQNSKNTASRLLAELAPASRVMVLTSSGSLLDTFWDKPGFVRKVIQELGPSRSGHDLEAQWHIALQALAGSNSANKCVAVLSDGQMRALGFLSRERVPEDIEVYAFLDSEKTPENTSIADAEVYPPFPLGDEEQTLTAKLERHGNREVVNLGFWADDRLIEERAVEISSGSRNLKFNVPKGAKGIRLVADADSIPADNERFVLAAGGKKFRVALVGGSDSKILSLAIEAGGGIEVEEISPALAGSLSPESYDLVLWDGADGLPPQAQAAALEGMPVLVLLDTAALDLPDVSSTVAVSSEEGFEIPATSTLFSDIKSSDLEAIHIKRYVKLETARGENILSFRNGAPLLWKDSGILYLTTRFTPEYTDLVYRAIFPSFIQRIIMYAAEENFRSEYFIGDTLRVRVATGNALFVETPALNYEVTPQWGEQGYVVEFKAANESGFYRLGHRVFTVNPDPEEASPIKVNSMQLERAGIKVYPLNVSLPRKLWLPLLILAVIFLASEFVLIFI